VGISGGKDSTATALWVVHESGYSPNDVEFVFTPTGLEAPITWEYIGYLSSYIYSQGYRQVRWVWPKLDFWKLAEKEGRFPSIKGKFCPRELKIKPIQTLIAEVGGDVTLVSGIRSDESLSRNELSERAFDKSGNIILRPILHWSVDNVWAYMSKYGIHRNPLYDMGFTRVGCLPCISARRSEIRLIAMHFPEIIDGIRREEERLGFSFFSRGFVPEPFRRHAFSRNGKTWMCPNIDDVVRWAFWSRGNAVPKLTIYSDDYPVWSKYALPEDSAQLVF
jgi:3'-phosphoadenosine 5'-phosphosulfate sulfotransferase (PAPS reductase)/FAD synthetase